MSVVEDGWIDASSADAGVGDMSTTPDAVAVVQELGLALVLVQAWFGETHNLPVGGGGNLHHILHHFYFQISFVHPQVGDHIE